MTICDALKHALEQLSHFQTAHLDAQVLLCHVLEVEKPYLIAHDDRILTTDEQAQYFALLQRRTAGEPIAYILGYKHFWDLDLIVNSSVLIPRPETEHLIEAALAWLNGKENVIAADIGTGSGAIAVTIAKHSQVTMYAVDSSLPALSVAQANARKHQVDIQYYQGFLAQPLIEHGIKVDILMANLPYIRTEDLTHLDVSKHEPTLALDGGKDGLDLIRQLLFQVPDVCKPDALVLLEIGMEQGQTVVDFANINLSPKNITIIKDYAGLDRLLKIEL